MANQWLRLWHDMPNDPKWRTIARVSKQRIGDVIAVYLHVLIDASANESERGRTQSLCVEDVATALDMETEQVESILTAMQGRVMDGDRVAGWSKRQPAREDGSAERAKAWRERRKQMAELERTQANAGELQDKDKDKDKEKKHMSGKPDPARPNPENLAAKDAIEYLNLRTGAQYRPVEANLKLVRARLAEGATLDDVKAVIDDRCRKWSGDPKMSEYLRPATLFSPTNFAQYLGQLPGSQLPPEGWWGSAGFKDQFSAENAGCTAKTAHLWRDGARILETV